MMISKACFEAVLTETSYVISELKDTIKNLGKWAKPRRFSIATQFPFHRLYL
jgi:aldehyde dehydrogenase (NAD+)